MMATYNGEKYISEQLDSIAFTEYIRKDYEIHICDDGSTDGTVAIAKEYAEKDSRVRSRCGRMRQIRGIPEIFCKALCSE